MGAGGKFRAIGSIFSIEGLGQGSSNKTVDKCPPTRTAAVKIPGCFGFHSRNGRRGRGSAAAKSKQGSRQGTIRIPEDVVGDLKRAAPLKRHGVPEETINEAVAELRV